jgi:hypothetical protein
MTWVKLDDAILDNPKIARAGVYGFAMHVAAITWCGRNLTDGHIPYSRVTALLALQYVNIDCSNPLALPGGGSGLSGEEGLDPYVVAAHLVSIGLWHETPDGYEIHDYLEYNPPKAKVLADRERSAQRVKKHRSNAVASRVSNAVGNNHVAPAPVPVPVPDQDPKAVEANPKDLTGSAPPHAAEGGSGSGEGNRPGAGVYDLESALRLPVFERAKLAVAKGTAMADYLEPNAWPEVRQVGEAFGRATGQTGIRLGPYSRDVGVRAIVALLATPYQPTELERAIRHLVTEPWWNAEGRSKGLSSLTPEVIRRALVNAPPSKAERLAGMSPTVRAIVEGGK